MLELLPVALAIFAVCVANYTDLKERIIPNKLTFPMIGAGVIFYAIFGFSRRDPLTALSGVFGAALAFAVGYAIWMTGGWAGGDVKLFTALGALLPGLGQSYKAPYSRAPYPFSLTILFNSVIAIAPLLAAYIAMGFARRPGIGEKIIAPMRRFTRRYLEAPWVLIGCSVLGAEVASRVGLSWPLQWLLVVCLIALAYRMPFKVRLPVTAAFTFYGFYLTPSLVAGAFVLILLLLPGLRLLIIAVGVANKDILQEEVEITELKEGMIPAETIYVKGGKVGRYTGPSFGELIRQAMRRPSGLMRKPKWDRALTDPRAAAGITRGQVRALRRLVRQGKLEDKIRIKKGMPFAPALGLGLLISIGFGDLYWSFIGFIASL